MEFEQKSPESQKTFGKRLVAKSMQITRQLGVNQTKREKDQSLNSNSDTNKRKNRKRENINLS